MNYAKEFEKLMTTPCQVYKRETIRYTDGTSNINDTLVYDTYCNYRSLNINEAFFADKIGTQSAYIICLPVVHTITPNYVIGIENKKYKIIGVRHSTVKFENICEAVLYE